MNLSRDAVQSGNILTATEQSATVTLRLAEGGFSTASDFLVAYIMLAPTALAEGSTLHLMGRDTANGSMVEYTSPLTAKTLEAGAIYQWGPLFPVQVATPTFPRSDTATQATQL